MRIWRLTVSGQTPRCRAASITLTSRVRSRTCRRSCVLTVSCREVMMRVSERNLLGVSEQMTAEAAEQTRRATSSRLASPNHKGPDLCPYVFPVRNSSSTEVAGQVLHPPVLRPRPREHRQRQRFGRIARQADSQTDRGAASSSSSSLAPAAAAGGGVRCCCCDGRAVHSSSHNREGHHHHRRGVVVASAAAVGDDQRATGDGGRRRSAAVAGNLWHRGGNAWPTLTAEVPC